MKGCSRSRHRTTPSCSSRQSRRECSSADLSVDNPLGVRSAPPTMSTPNSDTTRTILSRRPVNGFHSSPDENIIGGRHLDQFIPHVARRRRLGEDVLNNVDCHVTLNDQSLPESQVDGETGIYSVNLSEHNRHLISLVVIEPIQKNREDIFKRS